MDGLDIAYCTYKLNDEGIWNHQLHYCQTYSYSSEVEARLSEAKELNGIELQLLHQGLGEIFAELVLQFINEFELNKSEVDVISSHGHTVFHQPDKKITVQIGCGETLSSRTGIPVINDFRTKDVVNGGQGAPLVPIGDYLLFNDLAEGFLNIGGFCNICIPNQGMIAFDIGPGNLPLNTLSQLLGFPYDKNGEIAQSGSLNQPLLDELNQLDYYQKNAPKSLGAEWLESSFLPILNDSDIDVASKLRTVTEHIAIQISNTISLHGISSVLITGGGAKNDFLINRISHHSSIRLIIPEKKLVDFKEAIVFGFLGALYLEQTPNCLAAVTGAQRDVIGGVYHLP